MLQPALLHAEGISKQFGTTQALRQASLDLRAGEVHMLLGENGAGKSTLAKIIAGVCRADAGQILINGQSVILRDGRAARQLRIGTVFQELSLAPHLSVVDNLWLGSERNSFPLAGLSRQQERHDSQTILEEFGITVSPDTPVFRLDVAQKQMVEIAKALLQKPLILVLDEPTSTLTELEKRILFTKLRQLQDNGVAILYVTHHLREVFEVGTRVSTMTDGRVKATLDVTDDLTETKLLKMMTGRELAIANFGSSPQNRFPSQSSRLSIDNLYVQNGHLQNGCAGISLHLNPGEIVGVYGVVGCGRETLGRAIVGLLKPTRGRMLLAGQSYSPRSPHDALSQGVGYVPLDRKEAGILPQRSIRENLMLSHLKIFAKLGLLQLSREREAAIQRLQKLQVRYQSTEEAIAHLSGGNQQKVLLGRAIASAPQLLVMEDPTTGIDLGTRLELYQQIRDLAEQGLSILLLSSDLPETLLLCNRVYSMYSGKIIREFINPSLRDQEAILADILGKQLSLL
ncbi:MAG: sugar ABC transporter ATP-binding protein [Leptolyngbyaceae cyanobacterium CRU_2_3]|nr:sugar ABC transporter ATP-binding protein [Leptolyngbyaceae cyanobacterium CRU_2_3]